MIGRLLESKKYPGEFDFIINLVGASGSGKSALGDLLRDAVLICGSNVVYMNAGDVVREMAKKTKFGKDVGGYIASRSEKGLIRIDKKVDRETRKLIKRVKNLSDLATEANELATPTILVLTSRMGSKLTRSSKKKKKSLNIGVYCPIDIRADRALKKELKGRVVGKREGKSKLAETKNKLIKRDRDDLKRLKKIFSWLHKWVNLDGILVNDVVLNSGEMSLEKEMSMVWPVVQGMLGEIMKVE